VCLPSPFGSGRRVGLRSVNNEWSLHVVHIQMKFMKTFLERLLPAESTGVWRRGTKVPMCQDTASSEGIRTNPWFVFLVKILVTPVLSLSSARWLPGTNVCAFRRPQGRPCASSARPPSQPDHCTITAWSGALLSETDHRSFRRARSHLPEKLRGVVKIRKE
jgi:hypothetical protein